MLLCIGASLHEILRVKGSALCENELWTLLRCISQAAREDCIADTEKAFTTISPDNTVLLPNGKICFDNGENFNSELSKLLTSQVEENDHRSQETFLIYSFGLTILWCAQYGLENDKPLSWSNDLQSLVTTMCDEPEKLHLACILDKSSGYQKISVDNDAVIIAELSQSIVGSISKLRDLAEHLHGDQPSFASSSSLTFSSDEVCHQDDHVSTFHSTTDQSKHQKKAGQRSDNTKATKQKTSAKSEVPVPLCDATNKLPVNSMTVKPSNQSLSSCFQSYKAPCHLEIGVSLLETFNVDFVILFPDRACLSVTCGKVAAEQIVKCSLNWWLPGVNEMIFGLAFWEECEYVYLDHNDEINQVVNSSGYKMTLYLRLLYFPPDGNGIKSLLLRAMYLQLRADTLNERLACSYDEALSLAALAVQCEIGDYQQEFSSDYFLLDDFVPSHVSSQLGADHVRHEVRLLHRQLAGIEQQQAQVLFLRKCSNFEEYGMNFHKTYRLKTCKEENVTWLGVGPRGITVFDVKPNNLRLKRHVFQWPALKKVTFKHRKISLSVLSPEMKLKFYEKESTRAKYVVNTVGNLHKFYASLTPTRQLSSLDLFGDITQLTSSTSGSPQAKSFIPSASVVQSETRRSSNERYVDEPSSSSNSSNRPVAAAGRNSAASGQDVTPSSEREVGDSSSLRVHVKSKFASRSRLKLSQNEHETLRVVGDVRPPTEIHKKSPIVGGSDQPPHSASSSSLTNASSKDGPPGSSFRRNLRTIRRSSTSSSASSRRKKWDSDATSSPVLSDARSNWSLPPDEYLSPLTRTKPKTVVTQAEKGSFNDELLKTRTSVERSDSMLIGSVQSLVQNDDNSIHKLARDFYQTSLSKEVASLKSDSGGISSPSSFNKQSIYEEIDRASGSIPSYSQSDSFSSTGITFYHSDSSVA